MNKPVFYIILFTSLITTSFAQNLVPNPSFEEYTSCPWADNQLHFAAPWTNPGGDTPDFFHTCSNTFTGSDVGVPNNWQGYQYPRTGDGYAGILVLRLDHETKEYIQVELPQSLEEHQLYEIKFYAVLSKSSKYAINSLSLYFTDEAVNSLDVYFPYFSPQITAHTFISSKDEWVEVKGCYSAKGNEKFIIIGNFKINSDTEYVELVDGQSMFSNFAYYYIDDVSITPINDSASCLPESELIIPNVFTPNNDGANDHFYLDYENISNVEFTVFNRWGNIVFEGINEDKWNGEDSSGYQLSEGVYFVRVIYSDSISNTSKTKTGYVHLIR